MQLPKVDSMSFDIVYPLQTLKPTSSLLRSRVQSDVVESNLSWRDKLEKAVLEVPLEFKATCREPIVSMSKLLRIKKVILLSLMWITTQISMLVIKSISQPKWRS